MTSKPRPSLLNLFDPLLADAIKVPIPESPPMTPQKSREPHLEDKENMAPNELTMSAFFNRVSKNTNMKSTNHPSALLVDLEDREVLSEDCRTQVLPRAPLTELSVDDFAFSSDLSLNRCPSSSEITLSPLSPLRQTQLTASPLPAISENDSRHFEVSLVQNTQTPIDSGLPKTLEPWGERSQTSSSKGRLRPDGRNNSAKLFRRRSSIDISTTLSSLSSSPFHMPDASFDLINGEISFLTKSSEELNVDHEVQVDSWEPRTPVTSLAPHGPVSDESPLDLSRKHPPDHVTLTTTTSTQPLVEHADISSESQLAPSQPPLPSRCMRTIHGEHLPTLDLENTKMEEHGTPPGARRISSVPAPIKKLRVFTSKNLRTANTFTKRGTTGMIGSDTSCLASKPPPQESAVGSRTSRNSEIPRGNAAKGTVLVQQHKRKPSTSAVKTGGHIPGRTVRSFEVSTLHKEETAQLSRMGTHSRLPGPAGVRSGTVANQVRYARPESTLQGRSIPVRSRLRSAPSFKEASRITESQHGDEASFGTKSRLMI